MAASLIHSSFSSQVLEEIHKQNEVIEIPQPIISIQLVLNIPAPRSAARGRLSSRKASMPSPTNADGRKSVNFAEETQSSSNKVVAPEEGETDDEESGKMR
jgi:hypothetical protein